MKMNVTTPRRRAAAAALVEIMSAGACPPGAETAGDRIRRLVGAEGRLSAARRVAFACLAALHGKASNATAGRYCCPASSEDVVRAYQGAADVLFRDDEYFDVVRRAERRSDDATPRAPAVPECWDGRDAFATVAVGAAFDAFGGAENTYTSPGSAAIERWNRCCSHFRSRDDSPSCYERPHARSHRLCCAMAEGLENHLVLPLLREPSVSIRLRVGGFGDSSAAPDTIDVEQEGALRPYDTSGVLWPAGYLLGLCVADPVACGVPEVAEAARNQTDRGRVAAVELGAGVGFASIAFAKAARRHAADDATGTDAPVIVATDLSKSSFALVTANTHENGVGGAVVAWEANHTDATSLSSLSQRVAAMFGNGSDGDDDRGFSVVLGSSLQGLFDGTRQHGAALWRTLDALLSADDPDAVALLSHVGTGDDRIALPPASPRRGRFECVRRISGDRFAMTTRDGRGSDFELVLLRRARPAA